MEGNDINKHTYNMHTTAFGHIPYNVILQNKFVAILTMRRLLNLAQPKSFFHNYDQTNQIYPLSDI